MSNKRFGRNQKRRLKAEIAEGHAALKSHRDMFMHVTSENDNLKKTLTRITDHFKEINQHSIFLEPKRQKSAPNRIGLHPPIPTLSYTEAEHLMEKAFFITDQVAKIKIKMETTQDTCHGRELFHMHVLVDDCKELTYCVNHDYLKEYGFQYIKRHMHELFDDAFEKWRLK